MAEKARTLRKESTKGKEKENTTEDFQSKTPPKKQVHIFEIHLYIMNSTGVLFWKGVAVEIAIF